MRGLLRNRATLACIQVWSSRASEYEKLRISVTTGASKSGFSFSSQPGMPPGHEALAQLRAVSFFRTRNSVTVSESVCYATTENSGSKGINVYIGAKNALLMILAREVGLESDPESICFRTDVGSVCVADCIPPSDLTSFHHLRGSQSLRCSTLGP